MYGTWGRPDLAFWQFTDAILKNNSINVFHKGILKRDFTYISDLVKAIFLLIDKMPATPKSRKITIKNRL